MSLRKGFFAGVGFVIGMAFIKFMVAAVVVSVVAIGVCHVEKENKQERQEKRIQEILSDQVSYTVVCNVRNAPSTDAKRIGRTSVGQTYDVLDKNLPWRLIRLHNGETGWAGCKP